MKRNSIRRGAGIVFGLGLMATLTTASPAPSEDQARALSIRYPRTRDFLQFVGQTDPTVYSAVLALHGAVPEASEERVLALARQHHPELFELLEGLKAGKKRAYEAAMKQLREDAVRLAAVAERDPESYEQELASWAATSKVRLLAARLALEEDPLLRAELHRLLQEEEVRDRARAQRALDRARKSVERMQTRLAEDAEQSVQRKMDDLLKKAGRNKRKGKGR